MEHHHNIGNSDQVATAQIRTQSTSINNIQKPHRNFFKAYYAKIAQMLADNNIVDINVTDVEVAGAFFTRKTHNAIYVHLPIKRHIGFVMLIQANNHLTTIIRKLRVKFKKKLLNADSYMCPQISSTVCVPPSLKEERGISASDQKMVADLFTLQFEKSFVANLFTCPKDTDSYS